MAFTLDIYPHSQRAMMAFNQPFDLIAKNWKEMKMYFDFVSMIFKM